MPSYKTQEEAYDQCRRQGQFIIVEEIRKDKAEAMLKAAEADMQTATDIAKTLQKDSIKWNSVYKLAYDSIHEMTQALLLFDKIKIDNHQCLYSYLCEKHPELEFNWEFFEKIRTKRNGISYHGQLIQYADWKEAELQFRLYSKKLMEEIKKRI